MSMYKDLNKAQLGVIGEHLVAIELLKRGWDAILANMSINNIASYDIVCVDPSTNKTALIQVKTSIGTNIPVGFCLDNAITSFLETKIVGPWVFVYIDKDELPHFYILSASETIKLINDSNEWYRYQWKDSYRKNPVNPKNPVGVTINWLEGKGEPDNKRHYSFVNPLVETSENKWNKIWEL